MNHKERDERDTTCPRCAGDAQWSFIDPEGTRVEINCPDCGRFEMSRENFDQFAAEIGDLKQPE